MDSVTKFEDLRVWQNARKLANMVYDFSSVGEFARPDAAGGGFSDVEHC